MRQHQTKVYCDHGERSDRTTSTGEPLCPLCRAADRAASNRPDPQLDWQVIRSGDDTWTDGRHTDGLSESFEHSDADILAALFADDSRGRRLRHRILTSL